MGQDVGHGQVRPPAGLVNVEAVFLETGEIDDAEVGTAGGDPDFAQLFKLDRQPLLFGGVGEVEQVAGVAIVRGWLAEVVEAGPDELAGYEGELVLAMEFGVGSGGPRRGVEIVRAHLKIRFAVVLVVAHWEKIFAARTDAGSGFAAVDG
jgi:hypothetical protein